LVPAKDIVMVVGGEEAEVVVINRPGQSYQSTTFPEGTKAADAQKILEAKMQNLVGQSGFSSIGKHANHDQSTHGNWARGARVALGSFGEVRNVTTTKGETFDAQEGGDAVPGGYNGYISLHDGAGKKIAYIDYQTLTGEAAARYGDDVLVAMVSVEPEFRRKGVGAALLEALQAKFPGRELDLGYLTAEGAALAGAAAK